MPATKYAEKYASLISKPARESVIDRMQHDRDLCNAILDEFAEVIQQNDEFADLFQGAMDNHQRRQKGLN